MNEDPRVVSVHIHMNIPPKSDKWIAFLLIVGLGGLGYSQDTGFRLAPAGWLLDAVPIAVLLTLLYVIWSALCRALANRIRTSAHGMTACAVSNAIFGVFVVLTFFWLYTPVYTTRARIWIPTFPDPVPDTPSHQQ
jgi:hypothetical protein